MRLRPGWLLAPAILAAAACSGSGGSNSFQNVAGARVSIQDFSFIPQLITIKAGQTVTWTNSGPSVHDVTSDTMVFESTDLAVGGQ